MLAGKIALLTAVGNGFYICLFVFLCGGLAICGHIRRCDLARVGMAMLGEEYHWGMGSEVFYAYVPPSVE